jgi:hypothetical protein
VRVLAAVSKLCAGNTANQMAMAKAGIVPLLIMCDTPLLTANHMHAIYTP